jgi:large subunit ribosomal protein L18
MGKINPRKGISVFRSARHIYAQIIDDLQGVTLVAAGTLSPELKDKLSGLKKGEAAKEVGKLLADKAKSKGIERVIFDRNGFLYHGRVKSLAESCREHGLVF